MKVRLDRNGWWVIGVVTAGMYACFFAAAGFGEGLAVIGLVLLAGGFLFGLRTYEDHSVYRRELIRAAARRDAGSML